VVCIDAANTENPNAHPDILEAVDGMTLAVDLSAGAILTRVLLFLTPLITFVSLELYSGGTIDSNSQLSLGSLGPVLSASGTLPRRRDERCRHAAPPHAPSYYSNIPQCAEVELERELRLEGPAIRSGSFKPQRSPPRPSTSPPRGRSPSSSSTARSTGCASGAFPWAWQGGR